ncbi:hypothetical protein OIO90_000049 [Microbotryomycetes sp. JL221]|nr:hypothetical protein OIO90_000049 [Microbotryomycetes sp. JL221]
MPPTRTSNRPAPSGKFRSSKGQTIKRATKQTSSRKSSGTPSSQIITKHATVRQNDGKDGVAIEAAAQDADESADGDDDNVEQTTSVPKKGKKPKVFVEDKNEMLSLIAGIAADKESRVKAKVDRAKQPHKHKARAASHESDALKKQRQLDKAKAVVAARQRAKKDQSRQTSKLPIDAAASDKAANGGRQERKRVSFA